MNFLITSVVYPGLGGYGRTVKNTMHKQQDAGYVLRLLRRDVVLNAMSF